jgi:flagellar biosynthesis protein FlhG
MSDFYARSQPMPLSQAQGQPLDQADGLRRLFAGRESQMGRVLPLVANPYVAFSGVVLDRLAAVLAAKGHHVLVVDAAQASPPPNEMAAVDLAACIERVSPRVSYLPAGGLPMAYVDTRGSAHGFIDSVQRAAPQADVVLLHADAHDLVRIYKRRAARPLLLGADHPDSIKHAYAGAKLLATRCELLSFDLLLAAAPQSPRLTAIAQSLAGCADTFLGAVICHTALIDPAVDPAAPADAALSSLLAAQFALDGVADPMVAAAAVAAPALTAPLAARHVL